MADPPAGPDINRRVSVELPLSAACAPQARAIVVDLLHRSGHASAADVASLLTSELVTNALVHTGAAVTLSVEITEAGLRVETADHSLAPPRRQHSRPDASGGRGLVIVERLATSWGYDLRPAGKVVWFELRLDRKG
jgi:anti-sigma regulatory factor (Ser/Thr protein kinase)